MGATEDCHFLFIFIYVEVERSLYLLKGAVVVDIDGEEVYSEELVIY